MNSPLSSIMIRAQFCSGVVRPMRPAQPSPAACVSTCCPHLERLPRIQVERHDVNRMHVMPRGDQGPPMKQTVSPPPCTRTDWCAPRVSGGQDQRARRDRFPHRRPGTRERPLVQAEPGPMRRGSPSHVCRSAPRASSHSRRCTAYRALGNAGFESAFRANRRPACVVPMCRWGQQPPESTPSRAPRPASASASITPPWRGPHHRCPGTSRTVSRRRHRFPPAPSAQAFPPAGRSGRVESGSARRAELFFSQIDRGTTPNIVPPVETEPPGVQRRHTDISNDPRFNPLRLELVTLFQL